MNRRLVNLMFAALLALYPLLMVLVATRSLLWAGVAYGVALGICAVIEWRAA